jgi:hypothetical protein
MYVGLNRIPESGNLGTILSTKGLIEIVAGCTLLNVDVADVCREKTKTTNYFMNTKKSVSIIEKKKITINYIENGKLIPKTFTTYNTIMVL